MFRVEGLTVTESTAMTGGSFSPQAGNSKAMANK